MAVIYLRSTDGDDGDDGSTWALAKATLTAALAAAGAGGTVYVSQNHAESQASDMVLTASSSSGSISGIICVQDGGGSPAEPPTTVATTATVSTTGSTPISFVGFGYVYGITFSAGTLGNSNNINFQSTAPWWWKLENCLLTFAGSITSSRVDIGAGSSGIDGQLLELVNTPIELLYVTQLIDLNANLIWRNTASALPGVAPTLLFRPVHITSDVLLHGVDLSTAGSGKTLFSSSVDGAHKIKFVNCKFGASVVIAGGTVASQGATEVEVVNCDSADTNYRYYKKVYQGEIFQETTIVRTGGASDGTTPISRKMVSTSDSRFESPLVLEGLYVWNETVGSSVTVTVEIILDDISGALNDDEVWLEIEYLGTSGFPLSLFASDRAADILASPAAQESSSVAWTTTGLTTPLKQKLSVTFTPQEKGYIIGRVMLATQAGGSVTLYVCPEMDLS